MKVRLGDIINSQEVMVKIFSAPIESAKTSYRVVRLKKEIVGIIEDFEKVRIECIERYAVPDVDTPSAWSFCKKDEEGKPIKDEIDQNAIDQFNKEMVELLETEQEINHSLQELDHEEINKSLDKPLSPDEAFAIAWCLEELQDIYRENC